MSLRMKLVEFTVLKSDIDAVLLCLGRRSYMQLDLPAKSDASAEPRGDAALLERLDSAAAYLSIKLDGDVRIDGASLPGDAERSSAARIIDEAERIKSGLDGIAKRRAGLDQASSEIAAFLKMGLPAKELELLTFIHIAVGKLPPEKVQAVQSELGDRAIILPLDGEGRIIALSSKKGRFALETSLKAAGFSAQGAPGDGEAKPEDIVQRLLGELGATANRVEELERDKSLLASSSAAIAPALARSLRASAMVEDAKSRLVSTEAAFFFRGWVARHRLPAMASELEAITEGRIAARSFDPEELPSVVSGEEKVPVAMKHGTFVSSFKGMVLSYGTPRYGTVDPTPFVACWFVLFFSLMFGDAGQGAVILLAGIVLTFTEKGKLLKWKRFAPILIAIGIGATVMGLLEGSFFSFEEIFVPATRMISKALFGREMDRFISIMPTGGLAKMVAFFGFSVAVGVIVNSVGIVLNMVNLARMGRKGELFFSKTGLAGASLFWYAIYIAVRALLKSHISAWDIAPMAVPLAALFAAGPLERLVDGHRPLFPDGFFSFAVSGFVEVLETLSYYVSNTVSFLRVGAFSLSHAVLSFVVFTTSDMMRRGLPVVGVIGQWSIIVIGNAVIMVLEGMVVTIQVMRLQYYEFFSKFFSETGVEWKPFSFAKIYRAKEKGDKDEA